MTKKYSPCKTPPEQRQKVKDYIAALKAAGKCTWCRQDNDRGTGYFCTACKRKALDRQSVRYRARKAEGLCAVSGCAHLRESGKSYCPDHLQVARWKARVLWTDRVVAGLCSRCGEERDGDSLEKCEKCREKHNRQARERQHRLRGAS